MVVLISGKAVRISPAPLPGRVLSAEDGYRFVPETRAGHLLRLRGHSSSCIARVCDSPDH
jgi:hypothetical protein